MEQGREKPPARRVFRLLRPFWWVAHAFTGYKIVASLLAGVVVYGQICDGPSQDDANSVRNLASYLQLGAGDPIALAPDGRIDLFLFVRTGDIEGEDDLRVYRHNTTGLQPTVEEMLVGDYRNFGYERFRGEVSPNEPGVPLLWDKQPRHGSIIVGRLVGFTQGRAQFMEEAEFQALLRQHGQLDLPEGP